MTDIGTAIRNSEAELEKIEAGLEATGDLGGSLEQYQEIERQLLELEADMAHPDYALMQGVLAYCLSCQVYLLQLLGDDAAAQAVALREIDAARASSYDVTFAITLLSNAMDSFQEGNAEQGLNLLEEARLLVVEGESIAHRRVLGRYWTLRAKVIVEELVSGTLDEALEAAAIGLDLLLDAEYQEGIVRAYEVRAEVYDLLGDIDSAQADREAQQAYI